MSDFEKYTQEAAELLRSMVRIPSETFNEDGVCTFVCGWLEERSVEYLRIRNNIVCLNPGFDPSKKTMMLCAHLDTVAPADSYGEDDEETICGLGSNDDGASVVCMLQTFRHFAYEDLPFNLMLALSSEEERSGLDGMTLLVKEYFGKMKACFRGCELILPEPEWTLVGEPTCMQAALSERGLLVIDATTYGTSAHAARAEEGDNALLKAVDDIAALRSLEFSRISPRMGRVSLNVTQINAGSAHNVIPDSCTYVVDIRSTECYCNEEILQTMRGVCKAELKPRNMRNSSSATYDGSPLEATVKSLGITAFSSPTTSDWMRLRCDALKMGPGDSRRSHKANEYVTLDEIRAGLKGYREFIDKFKEFI